MNTMTHIRNRYLVVSSLIGLMSVMLGCGESAVVSSADAAPVRFEPQPRFLSVVSSGG